jgi:aldose sugar dehydrogenase
MSSRVRVALLSAVLAGCILWWASGSLALGPAPRSPTPNAVKAPIRAVTVARDLEHPWGLAFLPDGRMIVTERPGRMRVVSKDGKLSAPLRGVPPVWARGQGGLLDVELDPQFAKNRLVYFTFSEPGEGGASTAAARGKLSADDAALESVQVIWRQLPKVGTAIHFGSRLVFDRDGNLFVTTGDRHQRPRVQDLTAGQGKVLRMKPDGSAPADNPFVDRKGAVPQIWSYGHRNAQAAALHPDTGQLWTVEHGAYGGDELNHPEKGKNYGWPIITYGVDYDGSKIGEGTTREGMEQPVYYWDPVIAPSGMAFYTGSAYPGWKGSVFIGSLQPGCLVRLELKDAKVVKEERLLGELDARIRDVVQGPDGLLYLLTDDSRGELLRVEPAKP